MRHPRLVLSLAAIAVLGGCDMSTSFQDDPEYESEPTPLISDLNGQWQGTRQPGEGAASTATTLVQNGEWYLRGEDTVWYGEVGLNGAKSFTGELGAHAPAGGSRTDTITVEGAFEPRDWLQAVYQYDAEQVPGSLTLEFATGYLNDAGPGDAAGTWSATDNGGLTLGLTVDAEGALSATRTDGCTVAGTLGDTDADRNLLTLDLVLSGCGDSDGPYTGYATLGDGAEGMDWFYRNEAASRVFALTFQRVP